MSQVDEFYDDPTPDSSGLDGEFFDDPQIATDLSRVPSRNAGLPIDPDLVALLAGAGGLATKPDVLGIAAGIVRPIQDFVNAILASLTTMSPGPILNWVATAPGEWLDDFTDFALGALSFDELLAAFKGEYSGADPVLQAIQTVTLPLRILLNPAGLLNLNLLPRIPIGQLTDQSMSLLDGGTFTGPPTTTGGESGTWYWDGVAQAAALDQSSGLPEFFSPPVTVSPGQQVTASVSVRGGTARLAVTAWAGQTRVSRTSSPILDGATAVVSGTVAVTVPATATMVVLSVEPVTVAGTMRVDDMALALPSTTLPQEWITGLIPDLGNLESRIGGVAGGILSALTGTYTGTDSALTGLLGWGRRVDVLEDGQNELAERADLLSPLQDYGSLYCTTVSGMSQPGFLPFTGRVGPMTGCEPGPSGSIRLLEPGLWDVSARALFDYTVNPSSAIVWAIQIYKPDGQSLFTEQIDQFASSAAEARQISTSVVVPAAGYFVVVAVKTMAIGRGVLGGATHTRLTVHHISRETSHQIQE
ncbi:MAG: hypothetical protein QM809_11555 [Gordonia sp. (in: high G+C Gram-positive bacteria)]|uniref:hypothetical protein n=1 Tax=Gordonia sp. (in: high G+C Gram-positive bacteria) TaxID=84139 RepID=UPI0039E277D2